MPRDRREWPPDIVRVHWHPFGCDLQPRRLRSRFRAKNFREIQGGSASPKTVLSWRALAPLHVAARGRRLHRRVEDNAFHLKDEHGIPHAHEVFHPRGVPVGEANAAVARSPSNCFRIIRAVNTDPGFVKPIQRMPTRLFGPGGRL